MITLVLQAVSVNKLSTRHAVIQRCWAHDSMHQLDMSLTRQDVEEVSTRMFESVKKDDMKSSPTNRFSKIRDRKQET